MVRPSAIGTSSANTGVTPGQYLAAQRSTSDRTEAATSAGFVPDVE
jgi:hypothetical protein